MLHERSHQYINRQLVYLKLASILILSILVSVLIYVVLRPSNINILLEQHQDHSYQLINVRRQLEYYKQQVGLSNRTMFEMTR